MGEDTLVIMGLEMNQVRHIIIGQGILGHHIDPDIMNQILINSILTMVEAMHLPDIILMNAQDSPHEEEGVISTVVLSIIVEAVVTIGIQDLIILIIIARMKIENLDTHPILK